jgi:hypothetical protein
MAVVGNAVFWAGIARRGVILRDRDERLRDLQDRARAPLGSWPGQADTEHLDDGADVDGYAETMA